MQFLRELKAVSEWLFFSVGILILVALLCWRNDVLAYHMEVFLRSVDLPFLFIALLCAGTSIRLAFIPEEALKKDEQAVNWENPVLDAILLISGIVLFVAFLYVDLGIPDRL